MLAFSTLSPSQNTDRYWVFGDSAAIDFRNLANPVPAVSMVRSRGTSASICDSLGNLLFYCGTPKVFLSSGKKGFISNKNHQEMDNGDSIVGSSWYQEMIIVPNPGNPYQYYVFSAGVLGTIGVFYSIVDLSYNGGLGKVIQKNVQLGSGVDLMCDGISAVKHGNGRDWWIVLRSWVYSPMRTNDFYSFLVTPNGVNALPVQSIGNLVKDGSFFRIKFNKQGTHMYNAEAQGTFERFDFDRCTGILTNQLTYSNLMLNTNGYWGFDLSADESKLYATNIYQTANADTSYFLQFDLNATNFLASADTLGVYCNPFVTGLVQKGPDDKIYLSIISLIPDTCYDYYYCYESSDSVSTHLSVVNSPDSAGINCNYQPFSFNLGGHKAYLGLPNNPNYELGPLVGSPCDTLTVGITETIGYKNNITVYYDVNWQTAFVNAKGLRGKKFSFELYNINGQLIQQQQGVLDSEYYTNNLSMVGFAEGLYVIRLKTDKEVLTSKFIKR
jgi:hypothetical protein